MRLVSKTNKEKSELDFEEFGKSLKDLSKVTTRELSVQEEVVVKELFKKYGEHFNTSEMSYEDLQKLESARYGNLSKEESQKEFDTLMEIAKNMKFDVPTLPTSSFSINWSIKKD